MHILKTWGEVEEVIEYLEYNMYEDIRHLIGNIYLCKKVGNSLMDVKVYN